MKIGIVGLPNVGKSTLFKALTKKQIDIANYPFCTIEPNVGIVKVPDQRLEKLANFSNSEKTINTTIEFVDIAGLVSGAHKGEGLGNKFLANIREVDAICHVIRNFQNNDIVHVAGKIDPNSDVETINIELAFADLETINKHLPKLKDKVKGKKDKESKQELKIIELLETKLKPKLEEGIEIRKIDLTDEENDSIKYLNFLTIKPCFYVLNVDENEINNQQLSINNLKNETIIPICAKLEADLTSLTAEDMAEYLQELSLEMTGLDKIILTAYKLLNLITFFTSGPKETRAWTVKEETLIPQAAGKIHTDFEKGFIASETINWEKLLSFKSEAEAKENGEIRIEGKNYIIQDGDVCVFRFNV